ncbi:MAG: hypothetical protein PHU42_01160 [Patescibacteria group bacterium]|nr:hypothetical protein [Patescibacteria group bacterium]
MLTEILRLMFLNRWGLGTVFAIYLLVLSYIFTAVAEGIPYDPAIPLVMLIAPVVFLIITVVIGFIHQEIFGGRNYILRYLIEVKIN